MCQSNLLQAVAERQLQTDNPMSGISYAIGSHTLKFTPTSFCLITGFRFGPLPHMLPQQTPNSFRSRHFGDSKVVRERQLEAEFVSNWTEFSEDDCLRICLLMMVQCFTGSQNHEAIDEVLLNLVDNLEAWNQFPWGSYLWQNTYSNVYNMTHRHQPQNRGFPYRAAFGHSSFGFLKVFPSLKPGPIFLTVEKVLDFLVGAQEEACTVLHEADN